MSRYGIFWLSVSFLVIFTITFATASAAIPQVMNIQGRLIDATTNRYLSGTYNFSFYLYNAAAGGTKLWSEMQDSVSVNNGLFDAVVGGTGLDFSTNYYLAIEVDGDGEMTPRQRIGAVGYSIRTNVSEDLECTDCIGATEITDIYVLNSGDEMTSDLNISTGNTFVNISAEGTINTTGNISTPTNWIN